MTNWHAIADMAPPQKDLVMVTGPSGYSHHTRFLALAYVDEEYRPSRNGPLRWHWARQINWPES